MWRQTSGFTLVEVLLSVGIIAMLAGLSLPVYAALQTRTELSTSVQGVADTLRRAQTYARGVHGDSQWGVYITDDSATLYRGTSYAARDISFDEVTPIPSSIGVSGMEEVNFSKLHGAPSSTGGITLTLNANEERTVSINAKGMVDY